MSSPTEVVIGRERISAQSSGGKAYYSPSEVSIFGVYISDYGVTVGGLAPALERMGISVSCNTGSKERWQAVLVYAFAFQSHLYNLEEPTVMILPHSKGTDAVGFGFDELNANNPNARGGNQGGPAGTYKMWRLDKLDRSVRIEMANDTIEELLLKRTVQGSKQPLSYASRAAISHRGGKLND